MEILEVKVRLSVLTEEVSAGKWHQTTFWQGADVVILEKAPTQTIEGFYPEPRFVETQFVAELSWLFERCRDMFMGLEGYGSWKEELFGRLGNMANRAQERISPLTCQALLLAVLHEGFAVAEEIENGEFRHLPITSGNTIYDDLIEEVDREGYLGVEATRAYFANLGIEI